MQPPAATNLYGAIHTELTPDEIVQAFADSHWTTRMCGFAEFELTTDFAELVLEGAQPLLLHGTVASVVANVTRIADVLQRCARTTFSLECYSPDGQLIAEIRCPGPEGSTPE